MAHWVFTKGVIVYFELNNSTTYLFQIFTDHLYFITAFIIKREEDFANQEKFFLNPIQIKWYFNQNSPKRNGFKSFRKHLFKGNS